MLSEDYSLDYYDLQIKINRGYVSPLYYISNNNYICKDKTDRCYYNSIRDNYTLTYILYNHFLREHNDLTRTEYGFNFNNMLNVYNSEINSFYKGMNYAYGVSLSRTMCKANVLADKIKREAEKSYTSDANMILAYQFTFPLSFDTYSILYNDRFNAKNNNSIMNTIFKNINNRFRAYRTMITYHNDHRLANEYTDQVPLIRILITNRTKFPSGIRLSRRTEDVEWEVNNCIYCGLQGINIFKQLQDTVEL